MPKQSTIKNAQELAREGKSPSTQAGEFVREEIDRIRDGEHGARSTKQAIAIALSEARRAGVNLPLPKKGKYSDQIREKAKRDLEKGRDDPNAKPSPTRSKATTKALQKEGSEAASPEALSKQAKSVSESKTPAERSAIAKQAARTRESAREKLSH